MRPLNLIDRRFRRLLVQRRVANSKDGKSQWHCVCDCGTEKVALGTSLVKGNVSSCGCLAKDLVTKHGGAVPGKLHPLYKRWLGMNERCRNPKADNYPRYGALGVRVCQEWQESFIAFAEYVGPKPGPGYTLDRIDPAGNYEPGNVRWATAHEQRINRRKRGVV